MRPALRAVLDIIQGDTVQGNLRRCSKHQAGDRVARETVLQVELLLCDAHCPNCICRAEGLPSPFTSAPEEMTNEDNSSMTSR